MDLRPEGPWRSPALDVRDLVVRLETEGISDAVAQADYGFKDTWRMAEAVFLEPEVFPAEGPAIQKQPRAWVEYLKGASFALPLLFACLSMLFLKFSLWGGGVPSDLATAVGLGTVYSFIASGGFIQAMARRGLFYAGTGQYRMCAYSTWQWVRWGAGVMVLLGVAGIAVNAYFDWLPSPLDALAVAFYMSLSLFWLATGILYMLDQNLLVAAATAVGIGSVCLLHLLFQMDLLAAQALGICAAAVFAFSMAAALLRRKSRGDTGRARRPSFRRTFYFVAPYFGYGCLYYLFLFADRLLAWTAHTGNSPPGVQFRGDYETGLVVGLLAFIVLVGWVHSAVVCFYSRLKSAQKNFTIFRLAEFNSLLTGYYYKKAASFLPLAAAESAAVYGVAYLLGLFADPVIHRAAIWSLAGFPFLVWGLWNVSLLFALSRPLPALAAIGCAFLADAGAGYALSRIGPYYFAVIGFTLGAVVFAGVSGYHTAKTFRRLDYYHFASAA